MPCAADALEEVYGCWILDAEDVACSQGGAGWVFALVEFVGCGLEVQAGSEDERVKGGGAALGGALGDGGEGGESEEAGEEREWVEGGERGCARG